MDPNIPTALNIDVSDSNLDRFHSINFKEFISSIDIVSPSIKHFLNTGDNAEAHKKALDKVLKLINDHGENLENKPFILWECSGEAFSVKTLPEKERLKSLGFITNTLSRHSEV